MVLLTVVAMFTPSWFTLQWTVSAATFLQVPFYSFLHSLFQVGLWFVIPESPRWLSATNR
jgi:hypothetical protein